MARLQQATDSSMLIERFVSMCRNSRAPDGDLQEDGWGIAWLDGSGKWLSRKSIRPILDDIPQPACNLPAAHILLIHARSASFSHHKHDIIFNQPFISDQFGFVFNGLIRGVRFPRPLPGKIGAQKIWNLLLELLKMYPPEEALGRLASYMDSCSREIAALNLGLCSRGKFYIFNQYTGNREYYTLHMSRTSNLSMICSEPLDGYAFAPVAPEQVVCL